MRKARSVLKQMAAAVLAVAGAPTGATALSGGQPLAQIVPDARFAVVIEARRGEDTLTCAGALIDRDVVLTAGHCLFGASTVTAALADGVTGRTLVPTAARLWTAHPLWAGEGMGPGWDARITAATAARWVDLGLVVLAAPMAGGTPVRLAGPSPAPARLAAIGVARDDRREQREAMNAAWVRVTGTYGTPGVLRVQGDDALGWCPGDSGGPLVEWAADGVRLRGVVGLGTLPIAPNEAQIRHWGGAARVPRCGAVATVVDVARHLAWIEQTLDLLVPDRPVSLAGLRR